MPPPTRPPPSYPRPRRALSGQGGEVETRGADELAAPLAEALAAGGSEVEQENATHGFHSYPARMHPAIAGALIERFSAPGDALLDPFCGSGTVLIEALRSGRRATGVDLNPLAIRVAEVQTALRGAEDRERFAVELARLGEASLERVRERVPVRAALSAHERTFYGPHVLLELAGLRAEIDGVEREDDRRAFEIVFSSLLVKFSLQRGDTSDELIEKRI
ncbi:MAG TPA: DNA methyltransferase, partial [Polyangiales bacterium]|nr:DNA methyltransferase [Polyangiales bacterium]